MRIFLIKWFINIVALLAVVHLIQGINVDRWQTAVVAALVLGLVNAFLKPLVMLLTLPLNILSLGLLTFIINGFMFYLVSIVVRGFHIVSFWNAFWGAFFFSMISFILNLLIRPQGKLSWRFYGYDSGCKPKYRDAIDIEGKAEDN